MEYSILNDGRTDYEITYKNAYIHLIVGKDYYNTDKQSIEFDLIFDKLFVITEDDIISNEEINHPISNPN